MLEVAADGQIISKSVTFEYKQQNSAKTAAPDTHRSNTSLQEKYLRTLLLQKLEALDICSVQDKDAFLEQSLESKVLCDFQ